MKKILLPISAVLFLLVFCITASGAFEMTTINGTVQFKCNLLSKYMKKHGYSFIEEVIYDKKFKTNLFAARDAEVIIKNKYDTVLASGKADENGKFSLSVPSDNNYRIVVRFHDRLMEDEVDYMDAQHYTADLGLFDSDKVDSWHTQTPVTYCYDCGIRYLENQEAILASRH